MRLSVVIGCDDIDLTKLILTRVLHPASCLDHLATVVDAVELVALLNSTEVDLVIIDPNLPRLTKGLVKQITAGHKLIAINQPDNQLQRKLGLSSKTVEMVELAIRLGEFKQLPAATNSEGEASQVISIFAVASGSGASTIATNLAYLKGQLNQVLLADFDLTHPALAAQLNINSAQAGLLLLNQLAQQAPLTTAEFALHCIELQPNLRLMPGISSASAAAELDYRVMDEVVAIATELDEVVIADLGQLQARGDVADFQRQLISISNQVYLITAADPISILTTCNWLAVNGSSFQGKLQIVINKVTSKTEQAQLASLISAAAGNDPAVFIWADFKLLEHALWRGEIAVGLKPKSSFSRSIAGLVAGAKLPKLNVKLQNQSKAQKQPKALKRLEQAS
jgi:MinD-like ATPase involved in chromosome partitioning or flagellar assembly